LNTRELAQLQDWDEETLRELVPRFVRTFHRLPSRDQLVLFHRARRGLQMRIPVQRRRRMASLIASY